MSDGAGQTIDSDADASGFLAGSGEMASLMRGHDWSKTSLAPPSNWPQALRTVVRLMLNTGHPMYIFWGEDGACLYNDAYRQSIGPERHPVSLGRPAREVWNEIWDIIGPQVEQVMAGRGATWHKDALVPITRNGKREDVYWTYSYSPIDDVTAPNGVGGVLVVCTETTETVMAERRRAHEIEQFRTLFDQAPTFMALLMGPEHRFAMTNPGFVKLLGGRNVVGQTVAEATPEAIDQGFMALLDSVFASGEAYSAKGVRYYRPGTDGDGYYLDFVYQPMKDADGKVIGIFVEGVDVTDRWHAEQAQRDSHEKLQMALNSGAVVGTWVWDITTGRVLGDERFARAFQLTETEALDGFPARDSFTHIHPDDHDGLSEAMSAARNGGTSFRAEYRLRTNDGWRWVEASGAIERDTEGNAVRFPGVLIDIDSRKKTEEALRETHKQLRMAQNAGGIIGTWFWDLSHGKVTGDEGFARTFLIDPAALAGGIEFAQIVDAVHPEDLPGMTAAVQKAMASGDTCIIDYRVRRPDDDEEVRAGNPWRWIRAMGKAELDANGMALNQAGIVVDVDARKRVEQALEESRYQLGMAQKFGGIGVFSVPVDSDAVTVSEEFCTIFGIPFVSPTSLEAIAVNVMPEDGSAKSTVENRTGGTTPPEAEYRIRRVSDGELRWVFRRAEFLRDADGKPTHMVGMVLDITERKQATLRLKESQDYFNLMVESVQDHAIISLDEGGRIVLWNAGAQCMFGARPEEALGQSIDMIFLPEDREHGVPRIELEIAARDGRVSDERWLQRKNGQRFFASGTTAAMRDADGRIKGFIKIARDMTVQHEAQDAILQARNAAEAANTAKSEFLANMSHEIRTPMNAIVGLSIILARSQPLTSRQSEYLRTLQSSADALLALINDLLDIAKIEAQTVELESIPFSPEELVRNVAGMLAGEAREKGLSLKVESDDCFRDLLFLGDPTRLRQIIMNLCSNAIKFTEAGGVRLVVRRQPSDRPRHDEVCITVEDSGVGIPAGKLDAVFQKFVQADSSINRKYGGTGLGLSISKMLTEAMGGTICVTSREGHGSAFSVRIPMEAVTGPGKVTSAPSPVNGDKNVPPASTPQVLLVEDNSANVLVARTFLEDFGFKVDVATNGLEAVERAKSQAYAAILMDVQMHGMNGLDTTRTIRDLEQMQGRPRCRIIGMTAHALSGDRERCLAVGMDDYIAKPFRPDELRLKLTAAMD